MRRDMLVQNRARGTWCGTVVALDRFALWLYSVRLVGRKSYSETNETERGNPLARRGWNNQNTSPNRHVQKIALEAMGFSSGTRKNKTAEIWWTMVMGK